MKNKLIIFSKNRACQLQLLLNSIDKNAITLFDEVDVIYIYDTIEFQKGYEILIKKYEKINFIKENNFYTNVLKSINDNIEFTTFLVDDNVFYKNIGSPQFDILNTISSDPNVICFSLRLGLNCNYSHPADLHYKIGDYEINGEFLKFNYKLQRVDFAYPLSVDGHIFNTSFIKKLIITMRNFPNPNVMETKLQSFLHLIPHYIVSFKESKLVGVPVNIVNNTHQNKKGKEYPMSTEYLNQKYINNEIIDIDKIQFNDINGPHKEVEYKFSEV